MSTTDSPKLDYYQGNLPPEKGPPWLRRYWPRVVIVVTPGAESNEPGGEPVSREVNIPAGQTVDLGVLTYEQP